MRIASRVIGGVLAVTLLSQLTACGSIFYPDRRGQIDGKIDPATISNSMGNEIEDPEARGGYTLVNVGANWQVNETARLSAGVTNLFDKQILRTNTSDGANTFNEPGRAFYMGLTASF